MSRKGSVISGEKSQRDKIMMLINKIIPEGVEDEIKVRIQIYSINLLNSGIKGLQKDKDYSNELLNKVYKCQRSRTDPQNTSRQAKLLLSKFKTKKVFKNKQNLIYLLTKLSGFKNKEKPRQSSLRLNELLKQRNFEKSKNDKKQMTILNSQYLNDKFEHQRQLGKEDIQSIIFDLLKLLRTGKSDYFDLNTSSSSILKINLRIRSSVLKICSEVVEFGLILNKIREKYSKEIPVSNTRKIFIFRLNQYLDDFASFIINLESKVQFNYQNKNLESSSQYTPIKLKNELTLPMLRIRQVSMIMDGCQCLDNSLLLSNIVTLYSSGNTFLKQSCKIFLRECSRPLEEFILIWMNEGIIEDPNNEFFIFERQRVKKDLMAEDTYLDSSRIPSIVSYDLCSLLYSVGRTRRICKKFDSRILDDLIVEEIDLINTDTQKLISQFSIIDKKYSQELKIAFIKETKFIEFMDFLNKVFFMKNGDFIDSLIFKLDPILVKEASEVHFHDVMPQFRELLENSSLIRIDNSFLNTTGIKIYEKTPGDTGWDVFSLETQVNDTLRTIFDDEMELKTIRMSHFLLRIRRAFYRMNQIWLEQKQILKRDDLLLSATRTIFKCNMIRNHMSQFLQNLNSYIFYEVIEAEWQKFKIKILESDSLDRVKQDLSLYLDKLLNKSFLNNLGDKKEIHDTIKALLSHCESIWKAFKKIQKSLFLGDGSTNQHFPVKSSTKLIDGLWKEYERSYYVFLKLIGKNDDFKGTAFKFDFNYFHSTSYEKREAREYFEKLRKETKLRMNDVDISDSEDHSN